MEEAEQKLIETIGHVFTDPRLLALALTHRSAAFEASTGKKSKAYSDNERLEFLGDSVLALAISDALWKLCPDASEGDLTRMRAAVVNEAVLAELALRIGVGDALRLGRGEDRTGGRAKPSLLANCVEALFAAVYLDAGIERAKEVIVALLAPSIERVTSVSQASRDEKTTLQELVQARHNVTPRYEVEDAEGPDHDRKWHVVVLIGEQIQGRGTGRSKKAAERDAARVALIAIGESSTEVVCSSE
jgi:ribonuclease III